jgi:hypothetical protein
MGKLKIYEINSLVSTIRKRVDEIRKKERDERVEEIKRENRDLIEKYEKRVVELNNLLREVEVLEEEICNIVEDEDKIELGREGIGGSWYGGYEYGGKVIRRSEYLNWSEEEIRNEVIIKNLEGNVNEVIDEIVNKFVKS